MHCGLLGKTLGHSYSPQIHSYLGDYTYSLFEIESDCLSDFFSNENFDGINVTIPYKKAVIPYCNELSETAKKLGAVNTIVRRDGTLIGHNTDYFGFASMLQKSRLDIAGKKVLVLGSGGASATVVTVLRERGANVVVISRNGENNYSNLDRHIDAAAIVNATPIGMYPNVGNSPLDITCFPKLEGVLDLIYNPAKTDLLMSAERLGIVAMNGLWMLVAQAKEAAEWFLDKTLSDELIAKIHRTLQVQMKNIVLIGMPGSGKSSVGKLLEKKLSRNFVDADVEIEKAAGITIPEIFQNYGERKFREIESDVLRELGNQSGLIIATGGGCVTVDKNYPSLHQNGTIIWLQRNIDSLPRDGRPLSQSNDLTVMYSIRKPMYERFSDYCVDNNQDIEDTSNKIINLISKEALQ